jgi:hypothetical protein
MFIHELNELGEKNATLVSIDKGDIILASFASSDLRNK